MTSLTINPQTLMIDGLTHRTFTADEFARIQAPPCPVCGATVSIERLDVTFNEEDLRLNGRTYIAGTWDCPRGCDPRTGQRRHYQQEYQAGPSISGLLCKCSCGDEATAVTQDDLTTWQTEHHQPRQLTK